MLALFAARFTMQASQQNGDCRMAQQISDMTDDQLCLRALSIVHELGSLHCSYVLLKKELLDLDAEVDKRLAAISKGVKNND